MSDRGPSDLRYLSTVLALASGETETAARDLAALQGEPFLHWCQRQQIGGLTYLLLEDFAAKASLSRGFLIGLRGCYLDQWARTERLRLALGELGDVFARLQEPFLVLKGLALAHRFYGSYQSRATGDLDVLLPRARAHQIADALEREGLTRLSPRYDAEASAFDHVHHVEFSISGSSVELHHALRVHATFRIDEQRVWKEAISLEIQGDRYSTLSDEDALLLHLLGFHTDIQIGQVTARWFVDLHQILLRWAPADSWTGFLERRRADGTYKICLNALTAFVVIARSDERFPELSDALARCRADIVLAPDRHAYLDLVRAGSLVTRKTWPLRQYEGGLARATSWWLSGLPRRIAAKPAAFAGDMTSSGAASPWEGAGHASRQSRLEDEFGVDPSTLQDGVVWLGSLRVHVRYQQAEQLDAVEELYRLRPAAGRLEPGARADTAGPAHLLLHVFTQERARLPIDRLPCRPIVRRPLERLLEVHEGVGHAWIDGGRSPVEAFVAIEPGAPRPLLLHSLMVVINRLLSAQHRYHVHAAAAGFGGSAALFIGGKGAGKSTISLGLGRAGATVFSEDHVMLRQAGGHFLVAGCDGTMHLTEISERHFFETPVDGAVVQSAGVAKKQVDMARFVHSRPHEEVPVTALFFPHVGTAFSIRALPKEEAVARLLAPITERHRFVNDADQAEFLSVFCQFVERYPTWDLTLSRELRDLSRLADFLRNASRPSPAEATAEPPATC